MRSSLLALANVVLLGLATAGPAIAASPCWDDAAPASGGSWSTAANWSGGTVPVAGDTVVLDTVGAGCSKPVNVVLTGASASVALVKQAPETTIMLDGSALTLTGTATTQILGGISTPNGGSLTIDSAAEILAGGTIALGSGSLTIKGKLRAVTGLLDLTDAPSGGGLVTISPGGSLVYDPGNNGVLRSQFQNNGSIALLDDGAAGADLQVYPSSGSPASSGAFAISPLSSLALRPTRGSLMTAAGSISGAGKLTIDQSEGPGFAGVGMVSIPANATLNVGRLAIGSPSALQLTANGTTGDLETATANGSDSGGRSGSGTLTAGTATIGGGHFTGGGLTRITGNATINGASTTPAVHDGAKLRTEGATAWTGGAVAVGSGSQAGTWENAGTLTITDTDPSAVLQLIRGSSSGLLRNLAGATINRFAPGGTLETAARIENAGAFNVLAGTTGLAGASTGDLVQSAGGVTTVAAGASLSLNVTLNGGTLRGSGLIRKLSNPGGIVEPGTSPGTLTVEETYSQGPAGTLRAEIAGAGAGQFDRLLVVGAATLGGTLAVASDGAYTPAPQSLHTIVEAASLSGTFAAFTGAQAAGSAYSPSYLPGAVQLCFGPLCPNFVTQTRALSVTLSGSGSGSVSSDPPGISCEPDCVELFAPGATVTLTATPAAGSVFAGWSGICDGLGPCVVTMSESRNVTATFSPAPPADPAPAPATPPPPSVPPATRPQQQIQVAGVIAFPATRGCIKKRRLRIRLRMPKGVTATSARIVVNGKQRKLLRGKALAAPVILTKLPKGRLKVEVAIKLTDGRTISDSRRYKTCS